MMSTQQIHNSEFLSVPDACAMVGIGRTKLYALLAEGQITARKAGTRTLIERASLTAWAAALPAATFRAPAPRLPAA